MFKHIQVRKNRVLCVVAVVVCIYFVDVISQHYDHKRTCIFPLTVNYPGPTYGLIMVSCSGRVVVKSHQTDNNLLFPTKVGAIIVGVNGFLLP